MSFLTVHLLGESLQHAIIVAVLVAILFGIIYQCFRLDRQMQLQGRKLEQLEQLVRSLVLGVAQVRLKV